MMGSVKDKVEWIDVPQANVQKGDMALHVSGNLDPREVTKVEGGRIWIWVLTDSIGPLPAENYTYRRQVGPPRPLYDDVDVELTGTDSNAFSIMGVVSAALRRAGVPKPEIDEYRKESMSGDYDHLIQTAMKWVNVS